MKIDLAVESGESLRAVAGVSGDGIAADAGILAGGADAVVDVDVTFLAGEAQRADALVAVDHVGADAAVDARRRRALVNVHLAVNARVTCVIKSANKFNSLPLQPLDVTHGTNINSTM